MIRLIAHPDAYNGKRVQVSGFMKLEFEGQSLYLHREDYEYGLVDNALWLEFKMPLPMKLSGKYVRVEGTFDAKDHGHLGMWPAALLKITRCVPLLGR